MADHDLTDLSVRSICQRAGLNRSTFYKHYRSLEDLLTAASKLFINHYPFVNQYGILSKAELVAAINYIQDHAVLYTALNADGQIDRVLIKQVALWQADQRFWPHHAHINHQEFLALSTYTIRGTSAFLAYCLKHPTAVPVAKQAADLIKIQAATRNCLEV